MKPLEELYREIQGNEEKKTAFLTELKEGRIEEFLKENDCAGTAEDVMKFINGKKEEELCDDDMEKVAGGRCTTMTCQCTYYYC